MKRKFIAIPVLFTVLASTTFLANENDREHGYTSAMFKRAMEANNIALGGVSSAPYYVLIRSRREGGDGVETICTLSTNLQGAIAAEYNLDLVNDARRIYEIAMSAPGRLFDFRSPHARQKIAPPYSNKQLSEVRRALNGLSENELRKQANPDLLKSPDEQSVLTKLYRRQTGKRFEILDSYRYAVARVLLERGILVGEEQETGALYTD